MKSLQLMAPGGMTSRRDIEGAFMDERQFKVMDPELCRERRSCALWWLVSTGVTDVLVWTLDDLQPHRFRVFDLIVKVNARRAGQKKLVAPRAPLASYLSEGRLVYLPDVGMAAIVD